MKDYLFKSYSQFIILFWIVVALLFLIQFSNMAPFGEAALLALCVFVTAFLMNNFLSNYLLKKAIREKRMYVFFVQFVVLSLVMALMFAFIFSGFRHLEKIGFFTTSNLFIYDDSFLSEIVIQIPAALVINLGFCGLRFYYEHAKLEKINHEFQLQTLQDQITPHFMFNVLNHIHVLMQSDVELASSLLIKYSDILRYQLYSSKKDSISLEQEVQFLKDFVDIEKIRWEEKLEVECTWKIENGKIEVPPLLFITFVENAFKHVPRTLSDKGFIHIDFVQQGNTISLEVKNSKSTPVPKKEDSGFGLANARKRLDMLYPQKYVLTIDNAETTYNSKLTITV